MICAGPGNIGCEVRAVLVDIHSCGETVELQEEDDEDLAVAKIVRGGPRGAIAMAGTSTAIVIGLWFLFYFLVFLPRGVIT
jgi:hypothetical protein